MKNMKRSVALLVAIALLIGCAAGGTMAWLTMKTAPVVNTFTVGNIDITLEETGAALNDDEDKYEKSFKMVPGAEIAKDPTVTVKKDSEACWLFVKVDVENNTKPYMTYAIDEGWTLLESGVYYRAVDATTADTPFPVLKDNKVFIPNTLTKTDMQTAKSAAPTLTFTAYAVQSDNLEDTDENGTTANEAWTLANS